MQLMRATCLSFIVLSCMTPIVMQKAHAEHAMPNRMAVFAKLPDWKGTWEPAANTNAPPAEPSFKPAWTAKHSGKKAIPDNAVTQCVWGMPRLLNTNHKFEVTVMPEQTFFSYDINEFRHVWTDGRKKELHIMETNTGYSIGHWEGLTLVIDTEEMRSGLWINNHGATLSSKAAIQERWSQTDTDHLKVDVTIHDPVALAQPFTFTRHYQRDDDNNHLTQLQCFDDKSRDGT